MEVKLPKRALVTGTTGYVGGKLADALGRIGWEVHSLVRRESDFSVQREYGFEPHLYEGSVESLLRLFERDPFDIVFHLAAWSGYECPSDQLDNMLDANIRFGSHLLTAMAAHGSSRLVNTGTYWQHAEGPEYNPICLYAASKQAFEAFIDYYAEDQGLSAVTLKLFDVYGEDDPRRKIFALVDKASRTGEELRLTAGEQNLRMIHVDDVVSAYLRSAELLLTDPLHQTGHHRYYVGGEAAMLRLLVERYMQGSGNVARLNWGALPYRRNQIMEPFMGATPPGWEPKMNVIDRLSRP